MEPLIAVDHDSKSTIRALMGDDKLDRIVENLTKSVKIMVKEGKNTSEIIEIMCNNYCDTPAEVAGVAILVNQLVREVNTSIPDLADSFSPDYFGGIKGMIRILKRQNEISKAMENDDPDMIPDEVIEAMVESHKDCDPEKCEIKRQGLKRGMISNGKDATE